MSAVASLARFVQRLTLATSVVCVGFTATAAPTTDDDDETQSEPTSQRWRLEGGAGAALRPIRRGDNRYIFSPFPLARLSYGEIFEASTRDGLSYAVLSHDGFRFGPQVEIDRKERQSTQRLGPAATILGTGGAGVFAEWKLPGDARLRSDMTEGIFGRKGFRVVLSGAKSFSLSEPLALDLGFKVAGGDRRYVASTYGIPDNRKAMLLPGFIQNPHPGSAGVTTVGPTLAINYAASPKDALAANVEVNRVVGTASHTPAVRNLGTRNAMSLELTWRRTLWEAN